MFGKNAVAHLESQTARLQAAGLVQMKWNFAVRRAFRHTEFPINALEVD